MKNRQRREGNPMRSKIMEEENRDLTKAKLLLMQQTHALRVVRDLKVLAKSSKKAKLTKIEKHSALLVDLLEDLTKAYGKKD